VLAHPMFFTLIINILNQIFRNFKYSLFFIFTMVKRNKIVLIGAGSLQFGLGTAGTILESEILKESVICLHDINSGSLDIIDKAVQSAIDERKLDFTLESTTNRKDALKNATFIINSIEIAPRFDLWKQDYEIPKKFGNGQIFGENGGPGGFFHSLRVIPPILDICDDVMKTCPDALFINFSNPMSRICLAISRKYPDLKFVGLCHEIEFARKNLPEILNTPLSNLQIYAGGLNHFGVVLEVKFRDSNEDAYPILREKGDNHLQNIMQLGGLSLIKYILKNYGYLPYTQDSHYGEYISWATELVDQENVDSFKNVYTEFVLSQGRRIRRLIKKGKGAKLVKADEESAIPIIEGILTDSKHEEMSVNLPNDGVFTNLPRDLVVECPAIVDKDGLHAVKFGEYPKGLAALLRNQASVQDLVVEAILTKSKDIALQALLADPIIDSTKNAEKILDEMLKIQKNFIYLE
jgi:alpha-galactosidase